MGHVIAAAILAAILAALGGLIAYLWFWSRSNPMSERDREKLREYMSIW